MTLVWQIDSNEFSGNAYAVDEQFLSIPNIKRYMSK